MGANLSKDSRLYLSSDFEGKVALHSRALQVLTSSVQNESKLIRFCSGIRTVEPAYLKGRPVSKTILVSGTEP